MKNLILTSIIIIAVIITSVLIVYGTTEFNTPVVEELSIEEIAAAVQTAGEAKRHAHQMANSARALGKAEDDVIIQEAKDIWNKADADEQMYEAKLYAAKEKMEKEKMKQKIKEFPVATQIWQYMKELGWNDYVCAGIMGNIMTEAGGQSLNINPTVMSHDGYYGICQWNRGYGIHGADLNGQLNFLNNTIKYEFDTYGSKYAKGFNFNSFLNLTDSREVALAFSKCYERCSSASYNVRQDNAIRAYNYFVD